MLDEEESAELRGLRARAFGVDADIQDDPVALARWEELEDRARNVPEAAPSPTPPATVPATQFSGAETARTPRGEAETPADEPAPVPQIPTRARRQPLPAWRRRTVLLAVLPITAVVVAAAYLLGSAGTARPGAAASTGSRAAISASPPVLLPLNEGGVRQMYGDYPGRLTLSLVARLDGANLWWVTADGGETTCLAVDTAYGMSSSCAPTSRVVDGLGVGVDFGPGRPIAYWVTPGGTPYIEVGSDINVLAAEHLGGPPPAETPTPSPTP